MSGHWPWCASCFDLARISNIFAKGIKFLEEGGGQERFVENGVWQKWCCGHYLVRPVFLYFLLCDFVSCGKKGGKVTHRTLIPGLWKHKTRPIQITLVVDDSGIKYIGKEHAQHLKNTLKEHYKLTCNWTGKQYIKITLDWDYNKCHVHLFMPNYVQKALKQFQHKAGKLQHAPHQSVSIKNGAKKQYATQELKVPLLDNKASGSSNRNRYVASSLL
jgi:hypothetical protein